MQRVTILQYTPTGSRLAFGSPAEPHAENVENHAELNFCARTKMTVLPLTRCQFIIQLSLPFVMRSVLQLGRLLTKFRLPASLEEKPEHIPILLAVRFAEAAP